MSTEEPKQNIKNEDNYKKMLSRVNQFVNEMNKSDVLYCDDECQKGRQLEKARAVYIDKRDNLRTAPTQFDDAEKNYLILKDGYKHYTDFKLKEYTEDAIEIIREINKVMISLFINISENLGIDDNFNKSLKNTKELRNTYSTRVAKLLTNIDNKKNAVNVANRKSYYDNKKIYSWCNTNYYLKIIFWLLFVGYVILVFFFTEEYKKRYVKTILILTPILAYFQGNYIYLIVFSIIKYLLKPITAIISSL